MSQFVLPQKMGFNVSPGIMRVDSLLSKLYPRPNPAYFYPSRGGVSGLGECSLNNCDGPYGTAVFNYIHMLYPDISVADISELTATGDARRMPNMPPDLAAFMAAQAQNWHDQQVGDLARSGNTQAATPASIAAAEATVDAQWAAKGLAPVQATTVVQSPLTDPKSSVSPVVYVGNPPASYANPPFVPNPVLNQFQTSPLTQSPAPPAGGSPAAGSGTGGSSATTGLASIPWYLWAGGAAAAFFIFGGKRG